MFLLLTAKATQLDNDYAEAGDLRRELRERRCDLLVAGAYGHSRLREFVLSGVTRDVLMDARHCVMVSH